MPGSGDTILTAPAEHAFSKEHAVIGYIYGGGSGCGYGGGNNGFGFGYGSSDGGYSGNDYDYGDYCNDYGNDYGNGYGNDYYYGTISLLTSRHSITDTVLVLADAWLERGYGWRRALALAAVDNKKRRETK